MPIGTPRAYSLDGNPNGVHGLGGIVLFRTHEDWLLLSPLVRRGQADESEQHRAHSYDSSESNRQKIFHLNS